MKLDNMFKKTRIVSRIQSHNAARASRPDIISVRNAEDISVYMHIAESRW